MMETVPRIGNRHHVPMFNPGSNSDQLSRLRLVNGEDEPVEVAVLGIDDIGAESKAGLTVPARTALTVTAAELETDGLGDGSGKWQLVLVANAPLIAVNLMSTPTGHVTNLSGSSRLLWRGAVVEEESRCPEAQYDRDEYPFCVLDRQHLVLAPVWIAGILVHPVHYNAAPDSAHSHQPCDLPRGSIG